jgi:HlyD family secretion protein
VTENVVTYDVVIDVDNVDGRLLPGMTATVEFIVARTEDALKVSNSALRFSPTESMLAEVAEIRERTEGDVRPPPETAPGETPEEEAAAGPFPQESGYAPLQGRDKRNEALSRLFFLNEDGDLTMARVETGITDGQSTVIQGPGITAGLQVIAAVTMSNSTSTAASNPFQSQNGSRPPGPRGGM